MNKRKLSVAVLGVAVMSGLFAFSTVTATATTLYDRYNFEGDSYYAEAAPNVGNLNDRASSVIAGKDGYYIYFEDAGYLGRRVGLRGNYNCLGAVSRGLTWWGENWGDRISSYY